jgi:uncharacterized protein (TIGR02145 family)
MKATGTTLWTIPNTNATNDSGFTGLPGGGRYDDVNDDVTFNDIGNKGYWWSSSDGETGEDAWIRSLDSSNGIANWVNPNKTGGFSVRCLRD